MSKLTAKQAWLFRDIVKAMAKDATDNYLSENPFVLDRWEQGTPYSLGDKVQYNGLAYENIQAHTSQEGWEPENTPALWKEISFEEFPEWKQPTGSHDAYNKGDKVSFEGKHYISTIDGNVWSPASYPQGWEEVA